MRSDDIDLEVEVACPYCGQSFTLLEPPPPDRPCVLDYDCEICCHPLVLTLEGSGQLAAATCHGE